MVNGGISNGYGSGVSCRNGLEHMCSGNGLGQVYSENGLEHVYSEDGSGGAGVSENVNGNLDEVLEDFDEYMEDISDRLMISRMVSDSVIKGMVTAVEQDCVERIAAKELELATLKEYLQSREVGTGKCEGVRSPMVQKDYDIAKFSCSTSVCMKREKMRGDLNALRNLAREEFKKVKREIEHARGSNSLKKIGSSSELVGLGGILQEKQSEGWVNVNKMLHCLKTTFDTVCKKVDDILLCSDISSCESQQDIELLAKVENVVTQTIFRSLREEVEENLLEQNVQLCGVQNINWLEKFNGMATLGTKLDAILKSLSMPEAELVSHGSHDFDYLHHKAVANHATPPTSLYGENGTVDEANVHVAESYDFQQLKHMGKEELVGYFNNIITKMKRDHESDLHKNTEEYFRLKREYLKVKGSFATHRKDEEFDALRKKIPEVISKLEDFLSENERFPALINSLESMGKMKHRLESLLSENHHLRDCLNDKENEVKCLKEQVSSATSEFLQRSLAEENMVKLVENLKSAEEDSRIETSLNEEIYKSALREQIAQSRDAGQQLDNLQQKVLIDAEVKTCLEKKSLEKENELRLEVEDKERLNREMLELRIEMEHKEKLAMDLSVLLSKEREQFELASRELITLREDASRQQTLVTESNKELESLQSQHLETLELIEEYKMEMDELDQKLDQTEGLLTEAIRERNKASSIVQEMHDKLSLSEAREQTLKKEMEMAVNRFSKIFADFEWRVSEAIKSNSSRLEDTSCHLNTLTGMANVLRRTELMYKQKLNRRNTDIQMAESEVDLLGDEVDALLRLLEKIYIALDHYSPVLKHYPGIIEILELVRRELSGEATMT
ncbi:hypothetical protein C2S52_012505 [Perilla frutescens var. hirtella]|nr:hypothetical protein C2S52_012505 [Perilla frutescens var. hirtella]